MRVFVKNMRGEPLMPCSQRKARLLLKENKAQIIGYKPFTIQLLSPTGESTQEVHVGVDTGAKHIGIAVTSENKVLAKGEVELRDGIHEDMVTRSTLRRTRRNRNLRYRPSRFLNRGRKEGWLPPTVQSKLDATFRWIDTFCDLVPNPILHIEVGKFDIKKIATEELSDIHGYYNKRYYVFNRDGFTCQCCKKRSNRLKLHHIVFKSHGGTDSANNLITVCETCHSSENHQEGGILYDWMTKRKSVKQYKDATFMNIVRCRTIKRYPNAVITYGYETEPYRRELGIDKTHYNDAISIARIEQIEENPNEWFYIKQFRKKKRSLHEARPIKGRKNKNTEAKRKNKNVPSKAGWFMNDMVLCEGQVGWIYGFSGGDSANDCVLRDLSGNIVRNSSRKANSTSVRLSSLKLLCHNNNWQYIVLPC